MKMWSSKKKIYSLSFGALDGAVAKVTRKYPNYIPFKSEINIVIGKIEALQNPMFDNQKTISYIFFCFRLVILEKKQDD